VQFSGFRRDSLIGCDPVSLLPVDDQSAELEGRSAWEPALATGPLPLSDRRLRDAAGHERWYRQTLMPLGEHGLVVGVLQDTTAEHAARAQAERSLTELAQWFDLSPAGMLVFDEAGLIVRSNRAFEAQVGQVPVLLSDAGPDLQALLAWQDNAPLPALQPGSQPLECQALVSTPEGRRRLSARVSAFATEQGQRRYMAVVEDRSAEEERDLAQLEIGALMDTAGLFVATYDSARGWLRSPGSERGASAPSSSSALQGIARDIVAPESLPEYERLQGALRGGQRVEVRYAVNHPELGQRWLLTRVEPGALAGGRRATSVVTLDVTDRERAQRRNEQLLRELGTILDGSTAGIAYLRGGVLVRSNHRFERMLDLPAGAGTGATLEALFAVSPHSLPVARAAHAAMAAGQDFDAELQFEMPRDGLRWYTLSLRPAPSSAAEAVAVLSDITRLKAQQAQLETLLRERELMFSLSEVGIVWQRGARIERANQAMAGLTGWSAPELTALDAAELYGTARECVDFEAAMAAGLQREGRFAGERRLRRRDGSQRWVQVAARPVAPEDPSQGVVCSFVDVDERHRARESLLRQAERTRAILDSVLVGIVTVSDGGIEWMNRSARRMFGGELADFVGEPIHIVATPEADHPLRRTDYVQRLTEGQSETFECRLRGRDGREFWVVGNAVLTARESTGPQLTFALLDIERRRQAEVSIARAQASLQRVIETAPLAIALLDGATREVLQANQTAADFLSAPPAGLSETLDAAPLRSELTQRLPAGAGAEPGADSGVESRADMPERLWDTRVVTLPDAAGGPPQLLIVASDVTEQRAADQARLQAAIAQREVLVKEVHHRIKNNLQGVAGLLQQYAARHPEVAGALGEAVSQVQAIAQVYGLQVGTGGPLRMSRVVEAIAQSVQRTFGRTIVFEAGPGSGVFLLPEAESIPIALVINELLTNAVKHGRGDMVHCALAAAGDAACLEIRHPGALPEGFDLARFPGGVSGLGLVRALLPRRSATLSLQQADADVLTRVMLHPPSVRVDDSATMPAGEKAET
jgi:PAS domain S-box-containing protein